MSLRKRLRTLVVCCGLQRGVLSGVPMRPEEIRAWMDQLNRPKLAHVLPSEEQGGDDPPDRAANGRGQTAGPSEGGNGRSHESAPARV